MAERLQKQKSDFTLLKRKHQVATNGDIFESDYMTINPVGDLFNDEVMLFSDSNFKFSVSTKADEKLRRPTNGWLLTQNNESGTTDWTLDTIVTSRTNESRIVLKGDYNSLQDFAYYGSAINLLNASITDIVNYFPAGLYFKGFPDSSITITGSESAITTLDGCFDKNCFDEDCFLIDSETGTTGVTWPYNFEYFGQASGYVVNNPFEIDLLSKWFVDGVDLNELRILNASYEDYETDDGRGIFVESEEFEHSCLKERYKNGIFLGRSLITIDGGQIIEIFVLYMYGKMWYLTKNPVDIEYIRPKSEIIEREFEHFDEFENTLLDRTTNPMYTAYFDTPYETETGYRYAGKVAYTWPSVGNYNLYISGALFSRYLDRLIALAQYYDENYSDNIWRSFTHEAIKNLDWTFIRNVDGDVTDYSDIDSTRIEAIERVWGRNSDDIKRFVDSIKYTNKVSYDQKNNIPDYFLSDMADMAGFVPKTLDIAMNNLVRTNNLNYTSLNTGFTASDVNSEFFRRLKLNSKYLTSVKGRREGIEAMLALLGIDEDSYTINEYITIATGDTNGKYPNFETVASINTKRATYDGPESDYLTEDSLKGLPVTRVSYTDNVMDDYVIPWYNIRERYANDIYFQMYGGWAKRKWKRIGDKIIYSSEDGFVIYDETIPRMKVAENLSALENIPMSTLNDGDMCYVINTTIANGIDDYEEGPHYYEYISSGDSFMWTVADEEDVETSNKIDYLNSIVSETEGNNPHTGYGKYDDGKEYLNRLNNIFGYLCDDLAYNGTAFWRNSGNTQIFGITDKEVDNKKSWFFADSYITEDESFISSETGSTAQLSNSDFEYETNRYDAFGGVESGHGITVTEKESLSVKPHNPESGEAGEEPASYSVVNVKNMEIVFSMPIGISGEMAEQYKDYVNDVVMYYVKQMIPSTTILSYYFNEELKKVDNKVTVEVGARKYNTDEINIVKDETISQDIDTGEIIIDNDYSYDATTTPEPSSPEIPIDDGPTQEPKQAIYINLRPSGQIKNSSLVQGYATYPSITGETMKSSFMQVEVSTKKDNFSSTNYPDGVTVKLDFPSQSFVHFANNALTKTIGKSNGSLVNIYLSNNTQSVERSVVMTATTTDVNGVYQNVMKTVTIKQSGYVEQTTTPPPPSGSEWKILSKSPNYVADRKVGHTFQKGEELIKVSYSANTTGATVSKSDWVNGTITKSNGGKNGTVIVNEIAKYTANTNTTRYSSVKIVGPNGVESEIGKITQYPFEHGLGVMPFAVNKSSLTDVCNSISGGTITLNSGSHIIGFRAQAEFPIPNTGTNGAGGKYGSFHFRENNTDMFPGFELTDDSKNYGVKLSNPEASAYPCANEMDYTFMVYVGYETGVYVQVSIPENNTTQQRDIKLKPITAILSSGSVDHSGNSLNYKLYTWHTENGVMKMDTNIPYITIRQEGRPVD